MNRIATTPILLTVSALLGQALGAAEPTLQSLETRLRTLESRLVSLENSLSETRGTAPHSYADAATIEATKGGQTVPSSPAPAASAPAPTGPSQTYVIQDGDTLGKIAEKFSVERKALLEANRLSEGQPIYIGETLMIPGTVAATPPSPAPAKQDSIVVGETKKPAPAPKPEIETKKPAPATTTTHTVAKGDTLTSVAKKYGTSVDSIKSANGLRGDMIGLGQRLKIPVVKTASLSPAPEPSPSKPAQSNSYKYDNQLLRSEESYGHYTVLKGDNLYALARDFFTTMPELQRINNLGSSTVIRPGDEIIVPTSKYNAYHKTGQVTAR